MEEEGKAECFREEMKFVSSDVMGLIEEEGLWFLPWW